METPSNAELQAGYDPLDKEAFAGEKPSSGNREEMAR